MALLVISLRSLAQLIDFDLPQGIQLKLSSSISDEESFWESFRTGLGLQALVGIFGGILVSCGALISSFGMSPANREIAATLFPIMGVQMLVDTVGSTYLAPLYAKEQLKQFTLANAFIPTFGVLITIPLVLILKSPSAICLAMVIESFVAGLYKLMALAKFRSWSACVPKIRLDVAKEILGLSIRSYPGNVSGRIAGSIDKVLVGVLNTEALTIYNVATRISFSLAQIFGAANGLAVPEMLNVATNEPARYGELLKRNLRFTTWLYGLSIIVTCAFGEVILKAWLNQEVPGFAWITMLMGIYWYLEMNFGLVTVSFFAFKRAHLMLPFALWNALVTTFGTTVIAKHFGLTGVASMNAVIDLVQIIPICLLLTRVILPEERSLYFIKVLCVPLIVITSVSAGIVVVLRLAMTAVSPLVLLGLIPVVLLVFPLLAIKLRWMPLPAKLTTKFGANRRLSWIVT